MSAFRYKQPPRARDESGTIYPGASLTFYAAGDPDTPQAVFADPELLFPLPNPLRADSAGRFREFFLDLDLEYGATLESEGVEVWAVDPVGDFPGQLDDLPLDDGGDVMPNATLAFYLSHTTELATIYADSGLTTPLSNPLTADGTGLFETVYLDDTREHRVQLHDQGRRLVYDLDPLQYVPASPPDFETALHASEVPENANGASFNAPAAWAFGSGNFTVQAWFRRWANPGAEQHRVVRARPTTGNQSGWELQVRPSGANQLIRLLLRPVAASFTFDSAAFALAEDVWGHVSVKVDRGANLATFYFNGVNIGTASIAAVAGAVGFSGNNFKLLESVSGDCDDVRVWNVGRSDADILADYAAPLADPGGEANLVSYWKFDEASGSTTTDTKQGTVANLASGAGFVTGPP